MIAKSNLKKVTDFLWEIPKSFRADMQVPAVIFASETMIDDILKDRSAEQLVNVCCLPGVQKAAFAMPDIHEGYGFPIGGVAATLFSGGVISPGGIGYDINCGVRLLKSNLSADVLGHRQGVLAKKLFGEIPSGTGRRGKLKLTEKELDEVLVKGARFVVEKGFGKKSSLDFIESNGALANADPKVISKFAKQRGKDQLGTIGAGNHFVEVGFVEKIFDESIAKTLGLFKDQVVVLIHTGSRGLGHQVATDYVKVMIDSLSKFGITLPDRELAGAPLDSNEGTNYFNAMAGAANFAWANREMISWEINQVWQEEFGEELNILYDVAHNIAKIEEHNINGKNIKVIVHRKGATRAFPGQPVIIPGSMGTASYVLMGTKESMQQAFGSTCHGAGRRMSRHAALKEVQSKQLRTDLEKRGIFVQTGSLGGLAEEAPLAYKDIDEVIGVVEGAKIAQKVARLKPVVVIKG